MKVMLSLHPDAITYTGGEGTLVRQTSRCLAEIGVQADVSIEGAPSFAGYDLVHVFGLTQPAFALMQARRAREQGLRVALTALYWDLDEFNRRGRRGIDRWLHYTPVGAQVGEWIKQ